MKMHRTSVASLALLLAPMRGSWAQTPTVGVVEIPFAFVHGVVILPAMINGQGPFDIMLDTGVNPSVIDVDVAKSLGLTLIPTGQRASGGGTDSNLAFATSMSRVQLGDLTATGVDAEALSLAKINVRLERQVAAILGYSLLAHRTIQIDYPHHLVRFYARTPPACGGTCIKLPFRYRGDILMSGVTVNGRTVIANLDTGSNGDFALTAGAVAKLGLDSEVARAQPSTSTGFNGTADHRTGTVARIAVGNLVVDQPSVTFWGKGAGYDDEPWDVRIGSEFLRDFQVTVDFKRGVVELNKL